MASESLLAMRCLVHRASLCMVRHAMQKNTSSAFYTKQKKCLQKSNKTNYRFENCGAFRAFFNPYLRRSLTRASRVSRPFSFKLGT